MAQWHWIPIAFTLGVALTWKSGDLSDVWWPEDGLRREVARLEKTSTTTRNELAEWIRLSKAPCIDCLRAELLEDRRQARQAVFNLTNKLEGQEAALAEARAALSRSTF